MGELRRGRLTGVAKAALEDSLTPQSARILELAVDGAIIRAALKVSSAEIRDHFLNRREDALSGEKKSRGPARRAVTTVPPFTAPNVEAEVRRSEAFLYSRWAAGVKDRRSRIRQVERTLKMARAIPPIITRRTDPSTFISYMGGGALDLILNLSGAKKALSRRARAATGRAAALQPGTALPPASGTNAAVPGARTTTLPP